MLGLLLAVLVVGRDTARFTALPATVNAGDSVVLTWSVPGAGAVFISRLGRVAHTGRAVVRPTRSRDYVLVAEDSVGTVLVRRASINVNESSRGSAALPEDAFGHRRTFSVSASSIPDLLGMVDSVLQTRFHFPASDWVRKPTGLWLISTEPREVPELIGANERTVGARRVAYRVEITERAGKRQVFQCALSTAVQYRKRIERAFYPEPADTLYEQQIDELAQGLGWTRATHALRHSHIQ